MLSSADLALTAQKRALRFIQNVDKLPAPFSLVLSASALYNDFSQSIISIINIKFNLLYIRKIIIFIIFFIIQ